MRLTCSREVHRRPLTLTLMTASSTYRMTPLTTSNRKTKPSRLRAASRFRSRCHLSLRRSREGEREVLANPKLPCLLRLEASTNDGGTASMTMAAVMRAKPSQTLARRRLLNLRHRSILFQQHRSLPYQITLVSSSLNKRWKRRQNLLLSPLRKYSEGQSEPKRKRLRPRV